MATILCIETATSVCSAALFSNGVLLGHQEYHIEKSHSGLLPSIIETALQGCGLAKEQIEAVAVSEGPGSYTGLRIGTSTAKGLCYALNVPLISLNTLQIMAETVLPFNKQEALLCPMIDARRMEVYACILNATGGMVQPTQPYIVDHATFSELLATHHVWFFGSGANKCREILGHNSHALVIDEIVPSARQMGRLAFDRFAKSHFENIAYFEPFYLKEFRVTKPKTAL